MSTKSFIGISVNEDDVIDGSTSKGFYNKDLNYNSQHETRFRDIKFGQISKIFFYILLLLQESFMVTEDDLCSEEVNMGDDYVNL